MVRFKVKGCWQDGYNSVVSLPVVVVPSTSGGRACHRLSG